jgi:hypothetical protein
MADNKKPTDPPFGRVPTGGMEGSGIRIGARSILPEEYISINPANVNSPADMKRFKKEVSNLNLAFARDRRVRPEILEAIIAVRGHNNPENHPYSVAESLLPRVNAWLEKHDLKPVLVDALAKRIPHT